MITSQTKFFPLKIFELSCLSTQWPMLLSLNSVFVNLLDQYIIRYPSCDNIPDTEGSLAPLVNVMFFFGSKTFITGFFPKITFNLSKAFCCFSYHVNSTFYFLKFANGPFKFVHFGTFRPWRFTNLPKRFKFFLFVGVAILSIFIKAFSDELPSFEIV